jgi:hypothetical protein
MAGELKMTFQPAQLEDVTWESFNRLLDEVALKNVDVIFDKSALKSQYYVLKAAFESQLDCLNSSQIVFAGSETIGLTPAGRERLQKAMRDVLGHLSQTSMGPLKPALIAFPACWSQFRFLLPNKVRKAIYEPSIEELKEDYILAQAELTGTWGRRWMVVCFTIRTINVVWQSLWACFSDKTRRALITIAGVLLGKSVLLALRQAICELFGRLGTAQK